MVTVNLEIFARVLFYRNFAYAKFVKIKSSQNAKITLSFTDIGKSCPYREFLTWQICENKILAKIFEFTVTKGLHFRFICFLAFFFCFW